VETLVLMGKLGSLSPMSLAGGKRWVVIAAASGVAIVSVLGSITFAILFMQYLNHDERVSGASADVTQNDVEREFQRISPLPLAVPIQHGATHKTHQGVVNTAYKTERSYEAIKAYYDNELTSLGWRLLREVNVRYGGNDYGGKELFYCKGNYTAHVQYAGRQEKQFGWIYSLALTWGLSNGCK
jgi:hypothetical protein